ncbi:MAG: hybrid sensor histidine kinase/response regulator [Planctomycetes bacterium]|nr:hybrid sensor histidine kinase/response regulator [Planctomycetota bacterium]
MGNAVGEKLSSSPCLEDFFPPMGDRLVAVIDDDTLLLELIRTILTPRLCEVASATDGASGLALCRARKPDLVLVDVGLPGTSGLDLCRTLKSDPELRPIPVLVMTALPEEENLVKAFAAGADDFLEKPFRNYELMARTRAHLRTKSLYDQLEAALDRMNEEAANQERLVHMLVHDMKSPLTGIMGYLELLVRRHALGPQNRALDAMSASCQGLMRLVRDLLDLGKARAGRLLLQPEVVGLGRELETACAEQEGEAERRRTRIRVLLPAQEVLLTADRGIVRRVLANLLSNALRHSPAGEEVRVFVRRLDGAGEVGIAVLDAGEGIPLDDQQRLFDAYAHSAAPLPRAGGGVGLGLSFCKLAMEAHGGRIEVDSEPGRGACFTVWFPVSTRLAS